MSIKIETYGSLLVAAVVVWYLARKTNLGEAFVSDVQAIPGQLTGYFRGSSTTLSPQYTGVRPPGTQIVRRPYTRAFQSM